jgi:2'-5' RNA ligase
MSRIRTFIAIDVEKPVHDRLIALQEKLAKSAGDVKWVEPENLHLTLLFLGEVDEREVPKVCSAVADVCEKHSPFAMTLEKVGCFPNARRPRVVWAGLGEGVQQICALHDDLEPPLLDLGCYRREERKYTPHLTLGRLKPEKVTFKLSEAIAKNQTWQGGTTTVREVLVMSSQLSPNGPTYAVMSRAKLKQ